jgi:Tfp pilus assembly protein PilX
MKMCILKFINKQQTGAALVIVMIMMALGGLMVVPLMNWMTSGMKTVQMYDNQNDLLYAADGGIQKGLWKISTYISAPPENFSDALSVFTLNGKSVAVNINYVWILDGIVDPSFGPHNTWMDVQTSGNADVNGVYTINLSYNDLTGNPGNKKVATMGVWLPGGFEYVAGSASDALAFPNNIRKAEPTVTAVHNGLSIKWTNVNYSFKTSGEVATEKFRFKPVGELPTGDVAWVCSLSADIGLSWDNMIWNFTVVSTATDPSTGKSTQIVAHMARDDGSSAGLSVITYQIQ